MKLNLKRGAALVLSASMTLQAPVPAFAKVAGHSANPAAYSTTSASSEAQLTAPEGTDSQSSTAAATSAPAATSTGTGGAETSA